MARLTKSSIPLGIGAPGASGLRRGVGAGRGLASPARHATLDAFSRQHGIDPARRLAGAWAVVLSRDA